MLIHSWKVAGTEKFTTRHERYFSIPHSWLSSCGKIKIHHSYYDHSYYKSASLLVTTRQKNYPIILWKNDGIGQFRRLVNIEVSQNVRITQFHHFYIK